MSGAPVCVALKMGNVQSLEEEPKRNAGHEYHDWVDDLFMCDAGQVAKSAHKSVCGVSLCAHTICA